MTLTTFFRKDGRKYPTIQVYISDEDSLFFSLYCLAHKKSRSEIVRPFVKKFIKEKREEGITENEMMVTIVDLVKQRWDYEKINNRRANIEVFKARLKKELKASSMPEKYISILVKCLNE